MIFIQDKVNLCEIPFIFISRKRRLKSSVCKNLVYIEKKKSISASPWAESFEFHELLSYPDFTVKRFILSCGLANFIR